MNVVSNEAILYILDSIKKQPSEKFESDKVEFKQYANEKSLYGCNDLPGEVSALANHKGGVIILGVVDSSNISNRQWSNQLEGFLLDDTIELKHRLEGKLSKNVNIEVEEIQFENKYFICIHVPIVRDGLVSTSRGKFCIRDGRSSRPMNPREVEYAVKSLQHFDWSSEDINVDIKEALDSNSIVEAYSDFSSRRNIEMKSQVIFLESIGATKNGKLNKAGLLFLGKKDAIKKYLGNFEFRFSRKTKGGELLMNEVWNDNIWNSIKRAKENFFKLNHELEFLYNDKWVQKRFVPLYFMINEVVHHYFPTERQQDAPQKV